MKYTYFFLLCSSLLANDLSFYQTKSNNLIIKSKSCELLQKQREAICEWKKTINSEFSYKKQLSCHKSKYGGYYLNVSSCLPKFVKENQNKKLYRDGANCWGTAMSFKSISDKPRFVWTEEIMYWQESPLCEVVKDKKDLRAGDIINTYGPEYIFEREEYSKGTMFWNALYPGRFTESPVKSGYSGFHNFLHSETYVSDELSFGKDSPNKLDRFNFHHMREVYGRPRDVGCQENQSMSPHIRQFQKEPKNIKGSRCGYFSLAYRCKNLKQYLENQKLSYDDQMNLKVIEDLKNIQNELFNLQRNPSKNIDIKRIVELADKVSEESLKELKSNSVDKTSEMILVQKYFSAQGLRKTLEQALLIPATELL